MSVGTRAAMVRGTRTLLRGRLAPPATLAQRKSHQNRDWGQEEEAALSDTIITMTTSA